MCEILLSIHPKHVENIFNGTKQYEFRKVACQKSVDKIIIYSTSPVMKVVGEAEVEQVLCDEPKALWEKTKDFSGIEENFFFDYYKGRVKALAYKLCNVRKYAEPIELSNYGIKTAPQSFVYIK